MFCVEISKSFRASQGLASPVRASKGQPGIEGFSVVLRVGVEFADSQLNVRGWFVDTDAVEEVVAKTSQYLASDTWTVLFEFRPTFEAVAKWACERLRAEIPQLVYVELENKTLHVTTRYTQKI
jgi:6-pyruvoyltetrahydropterin/6-carboxytetrahydropterin synthase